MGSRGEQHEFGGWGWQVGWNGRGKWNEVISGVGAWVEASDEGWRGLGAGRLWAKKEEGLGAMGGCKEEEVREGQEGL